MKNRWQSPPKKPAIETGELHVWKDQLSASLTEGEALLTEVERQRLERFLSEEV